MKAAVTISLVAEAAGGPFVFWHDVELACRASADLGFAGLEVFPPSSTGLIDANVAGLTKEFGLAVAAVGTGAGWVKHRLTLTDPDAAIRARAKEFVLAMIESASDLGAPVIIGSMQGKVNNLAEKPAALSVLQDALAELAERASKLGQLLLFEPINRYESNLCNTLAEGLALVAPFAGKVKLLADFFHMNIEETDIASAVHQAGRQIGHIHLADSNRQAAGLGHTPFRPAINTLKGLGYSGYLSAEALPIPDSQAAAETTARAFSELVFGE